MWEHPRQVRFGSWRRPWLKYKQQRSRRAPDCGGLSFSPQVTSRVYVRAELQFVSTRADRVGSSETRYQQNDIKNKKWTKAELESARRIAPRQAAGDDSQIDYEDVPRLTEEQVAKVVRFRDRHQAKIAVIVRLDPRIIVWLKSKGPGHLTRIKDILSNLMEAEEKLAVR